MMRLINKTATLDNDEINKVTSKLLLNSLDGSFGIKRIHSKIEVFRVLNDS
jgi:hypothetical protein